MGWGGGGICLSILVYGFYVFIVKNKGDISVM